MQFFMVFVNSLLLLELILWWTENFGQVLKIFHGVQKNMGNDAAFLLGSLNKVKKLRRCPYFSKHRKKKISKVGQSFLGATILLQKPTNAFYTH